MHPIYLAAFSANAIMPYYPVVGYDVTIYPFSPYFENLRFSKLTLINKFTILKKTILDHLTPY